MAKFNYEAAKQAGYSDEEIDNFLKSQPSEKPVSIIDENLRKKAPKFNADAALEAGYTPEEINEFLTNYKPKKSKTEKSLRTAGQYGIAAAENLLLPYELGVAPLASEEAQMVPYRENVGEDIERLLEQKSTGVWDEQDEALLENLKQQMIDPEKSKEFIQTADIGIRGLAEKATGEDLTPEGTLEKAATWSGYIKNPKNVGKILKEGVNPKSLMKAIMPTGKEAFVGLGAGSAMELAEDGHWGPMGELAAGIAGDLAARGTVGIGKGINRFVRNPKQALAEAAASFTPTKQKELQKEIIQDFRKAGIQADLGSVTNNDLIKMVQAKLSQSGLTGEPLAKLRDQLTEQIKGEYSKLAEGLGEARFANNHEAGTVVKESIKQIRDNDLKEIRNLYEETRSAIKKDSFVKSEKLANEIQKVEKSLKPGQVKSTEQKKVLEVLQTLKRDIYDSDGNLLYGSVEDLMNNKIALNDIINYEVQGGSKQLLKGIVGELDRAIISHGKDNPSFARKYIQANKKFSEHAKTFRNRSVEQFIKSHDPAQIMSKMNKIQGIKDVEKILTKTSEGKKLFDDLKRLKLDQIVGNNLVDSTTNQVKFGTFSKMLEKGNKQEIVKELLGSKDFVRLEKLQKNAGRLAESMNKFFNSSQTAVTATDAAVLYQGVMGVVNLLHGNPWSLMKMGGGLVAARKLTKLMADPEFLKLVEEAILHSKNPTSKQFGIDMQNLLPYLMPVLNASEEAA